jgi:hypothetical protein
LASRACRWLARERRLQLLSILIAAAPSLGAQILGARLLADQPSIPPRATKPLVWTPLTVSFSSKIVLSDNIEVPKQVMLFGARVALETDAGTFTGWQRAEAPGCSVSWRQDSKRFTASALPVWLTKDALEPETWPNLLASLRDRKATDLKVVSDDDSETNHQMLRLLGWRTRVFECEFTLPTAADQTQRQIVAACGNGSTVYVFTLEGPASQTLAYYHSMFERTLMNFRSVDK